MPIQLTDSLRTNLSWLASNWKDRQLQDISSYHQEFGAALHAVLGESPGKDAIELVIAGTLGKAADGYAHLLAVEPERVERDPFIALRILGDISTELRDVYLASKASSAQTSS